MRSVVVKFLVYSFVVLAPLLGFNYAYQNTNYWESANWTYFLTHYPENIELVNLGTSHEMYGIKYSQAYDGVAHNFATLSQSPQYNYYILRDRVEALAPGAVVLIPATYYEFSTNFEEFYTGEYLAYQTRYYPVMKDKRNIAQYDFEHDLLYNHLSVLTAQDNLKYLKDDIELPNIDIGRRDALNKKEYVSEAARKKNVAWSRDVMLPLDDTEALEEALEDAVGWYSKALDYCYEHGLRPVLLATPVLMEFTEELDPVVIEQFDKGMQELQARYPDLEYLDYSRDPRFAHTFIYFYDADHMNINGARVYTSQVVLDLVNLGYIPAEKYKGDPDALKQQIIEDAKTCAVPHPYGGKYEKE